MAVAQRSLILMRFSRKRRVALPPDPAEMGTAFGMEYVLDQAAAEGAAQPSTDAESGPTAWVRRWWLMKADR